MRTLTFLPSSFKAYSMVVLIPFSSTNSSFFGNSIACRSDQLFKPQSVNWSAPRSSTSSAHDVFGSLYIHELYEWRKPQQTYDEAIIDCVKSPAQFFEMTMRCFIICWCVAKPMSPVGLRNRNRGTHNCSWHSHVPWTFYGWQGSH